MSLICIDLVDDITFSSSLVVVTSVRNPSLQIIIAW